MKTADEMTDDELAMTVTAALLTAVHSGLGERASYFIETHSMVRMSPNQIETAASYLEHCVAKEVFLRTLPGSTRGGHER